jgi:transcriptional regulator with XRE-family HTH domain
VTRNDIHVFLLENAGMVTRIHSSAPVRWYIREWRKHRNLTLDQVAARLETTKGFISDLERGAKRINDSWIAGLAYVYDVEPSALLRDPSAPTVDELLKDASPEQRQAVIQFIDFTMRRAS